MSMPKDYENIVVDIEDGVAVLALNRPKSLNALNLQLKEEIRDALASLEADSAVRCLVLTGKGKCFSAGQDLNERGESGSDEAGRRVRESTTFPEIFLRTRLPTIGMIRGYCLGGAFQMSLYTDIRIASEDAQFGLPELTVGLACIAGVYLVGGLFGLGRVMPMLLTGDYINAQDAKEMGVVYKVVKSDQLEPVTMAMARKVAALSPAAVQATRRWKATLFERMNGTPLEEMWDAVGRYHAGVYATGQSQEGVARFLSRS